MPKSSDPEIGIDRLLIQFEKAAEALLARLTHPVESNKTSIMSKEFESSFHSDLSQRRLRLTNLSELSFKAKDLCKTKKMKVSRAERSFSEACVEFEARDSREKETRHDFRLLLPKHKVFSRIQLKLPGRSALTFCATDFSALAQKLRGLCRDARLAKPGPKGPFLRFETFKKAQSSAEMVRLFSKSGEIEANGSPEKNPFSLCKSKKNSLELLSRVNEAASLASQSVSNKENVSEQTNWTTQPKKAPDTLECNCFYAKNYGKGKAAANLSWRVALWRVSSFAPSKRPSGRLRAGSRFTAFRQTRGAALSAGARAPERHSRNRCFFD